MESILTSNLKELENNSGKLEESGKILGKDLWVMGPLKRNTVGNDCLKERLHRLDLNGLNEIKTSK